MIIKLPPATKAQVHHIECLFIDLYITDMFSRNEHLFEIIGREVEHVADLTVTEASRVIDYLKQWKEETK